MSGYTIDSIVKESLVADGYDTLHGYPRRLKFALDCLRKININSKINQPLTVKLDVDPKLKRVKMPADYVDYVSVGIKIGHSIKNLSINESIWPFMDKNDCGDLTPWADSCPINEFPSTFGNYASPGLYYANYVNDYGENTGGFYGVGGGYNFYGYFKPIRYDTGDVYMEFSPHMNKSVIYLQYISSGYNPSQKTVVNEIYKMVVERYIYWQESAKKNGASNRDTMKLEQEYNKELMDAWMSSENIGIWDIVNILRQADGQSIRG